jgi:hypothetical protein
MENLAIATMTHDGYGGPENAELMLSVLELLSKSPHSVYVADGGSSKGFISALEKMGHSVESTKGGLSEQHKNSIYRAATNAESILYMEPDKYDWVKGGGFEESIDAYLDWKKGLFLVSRTPGQFRTFPTHQQRWEGKLVELIQKEIGKGVTDLTFGPRFFPPELGFEVTQVKGKKGWEVILFLVGRAKRMRLPISQTYTASECPMAQRGEDNEDHRKFQFNCNLDGFYLGLGKPIPEGIKTT